MQEGAEEKYCQLTHPERTHSYLRKWPGLSECARDNANILALYAPQLTIRGFDDGLADVFDELLEHPYEDSLQFVSYDNPQTVDGEAPLCGEAIAWRHHCFGNYTDGELADFFVTAHTHHYSRQVHDGFTCLVWLLTDAANWLPRAHRDRLTNGMRAKTYWWATSSVELDNPFYEALVRKTKSTFRFSRAVQTGFEELVQKALRDLGIAESVGAICRRFREGGFVQGYFDEQDRMPEARAQGRKRSSGRRIR